MPITYMLDTNVFNRVLDRRILGSLPDSTHLRVTHVQHDELAKTPAPDRRSKLLGVFYDVAAERVATSSAVWDVSKWNESTWTPHDRLHDRMLAALDNRKRKRNNTEDILIAETALRNGYVLVTTDVDLAAVFNEFGGKAIAPQSIPGLSVGPGS